MEILGERPVWSMSGSEMVSSLDAAFAEIARLQTFVLHLIGGLETTGYAQEVGAGTTARLLTFRYRIDPTKARRDVHLATTLDKFPAVAAALPNPDPHQVADDDGAGSEVLLHPGQAEAIVSALEKVPATVPAEDLEVAEREMVKLGRTHGPLELRKAGVQIRNRLDTDGPEPDEQKAYDRESLTLKNTDQGVDFRGYLANENAELFRTLIHAHAKPRKTIDGALDPRSRTKRQADALTTLLATANNPTAITAAATGTATATPGAADRTEHDAGGAVHDAGGAATRTGGGAHDAGGEAVRGHGGGFIPGHGPKPHITVTIDFNDLKAATADKLGHLTYGDALSAATIRRLACDANILPIVLGSDSQPLDVGTTVRLATGPIRKALITRDKGCVCCGAPPIYCDAHHVKSWIDGGETKITNLALLCKRCHRDLHAGHWTIQITNGIVHVDRPSWATPDPISHGSYRPPTITDTGPTTPGTAGATTNGSTTRGAASATTPGGAARGSARAWPRDTDPPWITPEDAARLNPWGDAPDERPCRTQTRPPAADLDPWGEACHEQPSRTQTRPPTTDLDPWGDAPGEQSSRTQTRPPTTDLDPWGERSDDSSAGVPKEPAGTGIDPSVDGGNPTANGDRRSKLGTNNSDPFDPWADATIPRSAGTNDLADARARRQPSHAPFTAGNDLAS